MVRIDLIAAAVALQACALSPPRSALRRGLVVRGGGARDKPPPAAKPVAKDFNYEAQRSWVDHIIAFLEAPMTDLTIGARPRGRVAASRPDVDILC